MNLKFTRPVLLADCDGVLLRWSAYIPDFLKDEGIDISHLKDSLDGNQMIPFHELFPASSIEKSMDLMMKYNHSHYMSKLPIMEVESAEVLIRLSDAFEIIVITNLSALPRAGINREKNLKLHYGDVFGHVVCLNPHSKKYDVIKEIAENNNVVLFVDDSINHVLEAIEAGVSGVQFTYDMTCGRNTGIVPEVSSWKEIENILTKRHPELFSKAG
jgi:FMN phosphatase YigB (HAD superfamily)